MRYASTWAAGKKDSSSPRKVEERGTETFCSKRHLHSKLKVTRNLHTFRHTFATRQLHAGVPVGTVSKLLGHASVSTTLNIYAHVLIEHMDQFERQRARILGTKRALDEVAVAEERQVA